MKNWDKILKDFSHKCKGGAPDLKNPTHLQFLRESLIKFGWKEFATNEFIGNLREGEDIKIVKKAKFSKNENRVLMDISDTGKGINRGDWKNIFQPGYSSKRRGWGLGLSLAQRIVEEIHGGNIQVLSSKSGKTIFRLNFLQ